MRTKWLLVLSMVAGCGNDGTVSPTSVAPTSTAPLPPPMVPRPGTPTPPPTTTTVSVGADGLNAFFPQTVTITLGSTVQWVWDGGPFTATSGTPGSPDGRFCSLPSNETPSASACNSTAYATNAGNMFSQTLSNVGTFPYFSTVQGTMMTGTIVVARTNTGLLGGSPRSVDGERDGDE